MSDPIIANELPYLTKVEQLRFKQAQKRGQVSFFKLGACAECGQGIPRNEHKKYCSHECFKRAGGEEDAEDAEESQESEW